MQAGIHNFSEIGKLNKVLLHRPGRELEALTPTTLERLLFDDIPYLKVARQEHDSFAQILREHGTKVVYYVDEAAKAISNPKIREQFVADFLRLSNIASKDAEEAVTAYLKGFLDTELVEKLIAGIRYEEVSEFMPASLLNMGNSGVVFVTDPLPNLYFTRDPGACIGNGINIHHMHNPARQRESLLLRYIFLHNHDFATEEDKMWLDMDDAYSVEGGDVLVLSREIVAIGISQRTTISGAEALARNLLFNSEFKKVLAFFIPEKRAFMHLDTVFTMVDYDKFTVHPEIEESLEVYEITADKDGELKFNAISENLDIILAMELNLPSVMLLRCGSGDLLAAQREQWNDGSNTLCIAPGVVITYERNYITNDLLSSNGLEVITMPSSELSRGRGGPRCMSCPVNRENL